jgi:hypothetical protein
MEEFMSELYVPLILLSFLLAAYSFVKVIRDKLKKDKLKKNSKLD